jgi:predicted RNA methylase
MNSSSTDWPAAIIPLHYHYNMLNDPARMSAFKAAIEFVVKPGSKVVELGGGSAVMSFLAAQRGAKVYCVEIEPPTAEAARHILNLNAVSAQVEVIQASALEYLPPEPVDAVICEMVHTAMLREKQVEVMDSFRRRYLERFGPPLPIFIPSAAILAVQPVQQDFNFYGYVAPVPIFQQADALQPRTLELGDTVVTHILDYSEPMPPRIAWEGSVTIAKPGEFNAVRFITKNILSIDQSVTPPNFVNWFSQYLVLPLPNPVQVNTGQQLKVAFDYPHGAEISALQESLKLSQ